MDALHLTDAEGEAFWPIYRDYRNELAKVTDRNLDLILSFADKYETLTEEGPKKILKDYFEIQKSQNSVREKYSRKFMKAAGHESGQAHAGREEDRLADSPWTWRPTSPSRNSLGFAAALRFRAAAMNPMCRILRRQMEISGREK